MDWLNSEVTWKKSALRHGAETNRLAEAIGVSFLSNASAPQQPEHMIEQRAKHLSALGPAGSRYLAAGLTNGSEWIRVLSRPYLYR